MEQPELLDEVFDHRQVERGVVGDGFSLYVWMGCRFRSHLEGKPDEGWRQKSAGLDERGFCLDRCRHLGIRHDSNEGRPRNHT
jgi:transposase